MIYVLAILIGVAAGLRAVTPIAAIAWGAYLGWIDLSATPLAFIGNIIAVVIITLWPLSSLSVTNCPIRPAAKCRCSSAPAFCSALSPARC